MAEVIDATTMREFDALCIPPVKELSPAVIKRIRLNEKVSQRVFAQCLNTSPLIGSNVLDCKLGDLIRILPHNYLSALSLIYQLKVLCSSVYSLLVALD